MNASEHKKPLIQQNIMARAIPLLANIALLFVILPLFVPFAPQMPRINLDASWALGLNQALIQGLKFGKDIIFTLGPYSSIYTRAYHPATDYLIVWSSVYLACMYSMATYLILRQKPAVIGLAFVLLLLLLSFSRDSLFFSYPLLIGIIAYNQPKMLVKLWVFALLVSPLGLYPLIKGSMLIISLLTAFLCFMLFSCNRKGSNQQSYALISLCVPVLSMSVFWLIAHQSLPLLPSYLLDSLKIANAFTTAMSDAEGAFPALLFCIAAIVILWCIVKQGRYQDLPSRLFLFSIYTIFLFLSFKTGFTRHHGHGLIPGTSLLIAALLLPYCVNKKPILKVMIFSAFVTLILDTPFTSFNLFSYAQSAYISAFHGLSSRLKDAQWAPNNYQAMMDYINTQSQLPKLQGSSDVYSFGQTELIASGNNWSPRPIFQSYSVFNHDLATINKTHLIDKSSPDHLFFKISPIDERLPSLEDGDSWPLLLTKYHPKQFAGEFLVLNKNKLQDKGPNIRLFETREARFGHSIALPQHQGLLFASLGIKPTVLGKLLSFVFKPSELHIQLTLRNGQHLQYRMIAPMAEGLFLLSPEISNTSEFSKLYKKNWALASKEVVSFSVDTKQPRSMLWHHQFTVRLFSLNLDKAQ